jgi:hypothetical protein
VRQLQASCSQLRLLPGTEKTTKCALTHSKQTLRNKISSRSALHGMHKIGFWSVETVRPILGSFLRTELPEVVRLRLDLLGKRREM